MDAKTVAQVLDELGRRIEGPATHIWEVLVRQAVISGIVDLSLGLFIVGVVIASVVLIVKNKEVCSDVDEFIGFMIFAGLFIFLLIAVMLMYCGTKSLINPEYYAMMDILKNLPGGGN